MPFALWHFAAGVSFKQDRWALWLFNHNSYEMSKVVGILSFLWVMGYKYAKTVIGFIELNKQIHLTDISKR